MPNATPIHKSPLTGKLVSTKSKAHDSSCSQAASDWRLHKSTPKTFQVLASCRKAAQGHKRRQSRENAGLIAPGRETPVRLEKAADLKAKHAEKVQAALARQKAAPRPGGFALKPAGAASKPTTGSLFGAGKAEPAEKAKAPSMTAPAAPPEQAPAPAFGLKRESAVGRKPQASMFENAGAGRQGKLLDIKAGDLPGQTSLLDQVPAVETHPKAEAPATPSASQAGEVAGRGTPERIAKAADLKASRRSEMLTPNSPYDQRFFRMRARMAKAKMLGKRRDTTAIVKEKAAKHGTDYKTARDGSYYKPSFTAEQRRAETGGKPGSLADAIEARLSGAAPAAPTPAPPTTASTLPGGTRKPLTQEQIARAVAEHRAERGLPPLGRAAAPAPLPAKKPDRLDRLAHLAVRLNRHREAMAEKAATKGSPLYNKNLEVFGRGKQLGATQRKVAEQIRAGLMAKGAIPAAEPKAAQAHKAAPAPKALTAGQEVTYPGPPIDHAKLAKFQGEIRSLRQAPDAAKLADLHKRMGHELNGWEAEVLANRTLGREATKGIPYNQKARMDAIHGHLAAKLPPGAAEAHAAAVEAKRKATMDWQAAEMKRVKDADAARIRELAEGWNFPKEGEGPAGQGAKVPEGPKGGTPSANLKAIVAAHRANKGTTEERVGKLSQALDRRWNADEQPFHSAMAMNRKADDDRSFAERKLSGDKQTSALAKADAVENESHRLMKAIGRRTEVFQARKKRLAGLAPGASQAELKPAAPMHQRMVRIPPAAAPTRPPESHTDRWKAAYREYRDAATPEAKADAMKAMRAIEHEKAITVTRSASAPPPPPKPPASFDPLKRPWWHSAAGRAQSRPAVRIRK